IGQSNRAGRGFIEQPQKDTLKNVYLFTGDGWEPAANPLNKYSTVRKALSIQKLGPGYGFAKKLEQCTGREIGDRKSTRLNSSHVSISYAVFCLKKKKQQTL